MKYNAFISYSHAADGRLAPALQSALERFAKPWYKLRNLNLFRDETNLSVSPHLWSNIQNALDESEYLIYLASPKSANSKWVGQEIKYWLEIRSLDKLLIVLTDGHLNWEDGSNKVSSQHDNSLPPILNHVIKEHPFYVDMREMRSESDLSLKNPIFKKDVLKLAAQLHGKAPKDLASLDVSTHRKMIWTRNTAVLLLLTLLVYSFLSTKNALDSLEESKQKDIDIEQKKTEIVRGELERERLRNEATEDSLLLAQKEKEKLLSDQLAESRELLARKMIENTTTTASIVLKMNEAAKLKLLNYQSSLDTLFETQRREKLQDFSYQRDFFVYFEFDRFSISTDAELELKDVIHILNTNSELSIRLVVPYYYSFLPNEMREWLENLPNSDVINYFDDYEQINNAIEERMVSLEDLEGGFRGAERYDYSFYFQQRKWQTVINYFKSQGIDLDERYVVTYKIIFADEVMKQYHSLKTTNEREELLQSNDYIKIQLY